MDMNPYGLLALRLAVCIAASVAVYATLGGVVAVFTIPLWGVLLARPLIELASDLRQRVRGAALRDVEGRHFRWAGFPIDVAETADARWLRASQVQRILGDTAPEEAFARRAGAGQQLELRPGQWYVKDSGLVDYLDRSQLAMDSRRNGLRLFVQRQVIDPHRRARERAAR
jgi:hypothetical protein